MGSLTLQFHVFEAPSEQFATSPARQSACLLPNRPHTGPTTASLYSTISACLLFDPVLHYSILPGPLVFSILHSNHYYYSRTIQHYKINQTHAEYISYLIYSVLFCKYYNYFYYRFFRLRPALAGQPLQITFFCFLFCFSAAAAGARTFFGNVLPFKF